MSNMKNKGFTLIELLSVIVILGILAGISLPSISKLIRSQEKKQYQTHLTIVKAATDAYVDQFGESFKEETSNGNACSCYKIPYWAMIDEKLINEENVTCDLNRDSETKGFVIANKLGDSLTNYNYSYYLECKDLKKNKLIHETMDIPTGCCGVNGNFMITELTVKYNNAAGAPYKGEWTNQNIYQHIEANNPYLAGIKGFEYSLDGGKTWNYVKGKDLTLTAEMNVNVQVRAIDNENNKSSVKTYTAKIDKTAPSGTFEITGTMGNNGWYRSDVTIRTKDVADGVGSGISSAVLSHTALTSDTGGTTVSLIITDKVGNVYTDKTTIKLDKTNPSCVSSGSPAGWVNTNVTLKGTCSDNMSKCKNAEVSQIFSREGDLKEGPGIVYDNAGNFVECPVNQAVKIDKTLPYISVNPINYEIKQGNKNGSKDGFSYNDNYGSGILSASISVEDTSQLGIGTHTIKYTVTDNALNKSSAVRTLVVKPKYCEGMHNSAPHGCPTNDPSTKVTIVIPTLYRFRYYSAGPDGSCDIEDNVMRCYCACGVDCKHGGEVRGSVVVDGKTIPRIDYQPCFHLWEDRWIEQNDCSAYFGDGATTWSRCNGTEVNRAQRDVKAGYSYDVWLWY